MKYIRLTSEVKATDLIILMDYTVNIYTLYAVYLKYDMCCTMTRGGLKGSCGPNNLY